jgi:TIR domain
VKIFLSWSTGPSKFIAEALKDWIPNVIQAAQPWFSDTDIYPGTKWSAEIAKELEVSKFGVLCITPENLKAPWINFEAGALSKFVQDSHVVPVLFNLEPTDLVGPLAQFNAIRLNREDMKKLVNLINQVLERPLENRKIEESFDVWWPKLEEKLSKIPKIEIKEVDKRTDRNLIEEILGLIRAQQKLRIPESMIRRTGIEFVGGIEIDFSREVGDFDIGISVFHVRYGIGKITETKGEGARKEVIVDFISSIGLRKFLLHYANLGIIKNENPSEYVETYVDTYEDTDLEGVDPDEELPF